MEWVGGSGFAFKTEGKGLSCVGNGGKFRCLLPGSQIRSCFLWYKKVQSLVRKSLSEQYFRTLASNVAVLDFSKAAFLNAIQIFCAIVDSYRWINLLLSRLWQRASSSPQKWSNRHYFLHETHVKYTCVSYISVFGALFFRGKSLTLKGRKQKRNCCIHAFATEPYCCCTDNGFSSIVLLFACGIS